MKIYDVIVMIFLFSWQENEANIILSGNQSSAYIASYSNYAQKVDGVLDQTFGKQGVSLINQFLAGGDFDEIDVIALQPDGKIVAAGYSKDDRECPHFALARFLPDGSLDLTFGATTESTTCSLPGTVYITQSIGGVTDANMDDEIDALCIQPDGCILVGGFATTYTDLQSQHHFAVARFLPDGTLDSSFGHTTSSTTTIIPGTTFITESITLSNSDNFDDEIRTLVYQVDTKTFVVGGFSQDRAENSHFALARFLSDGTLDPSFGQNVPNSTTSTTPGTVYITDNISDQITDVIDSIVLQADNCIIAAGYSNAGYWGTPVNSYCALARFLPNGVLDSSFGKTVINSTMSGIPGTVYIPLSIANADPGSVKDLLFSVLLQPDGKIVAGGYSNDPEGDGHFAVVRFLPQGILDSSFGQNVPNSTTSFIPGTVFIPRFLLLVGDRTDDRIYSIALQVDRKIITAGFTNDTSRFALARFLENGTLDQTFGQTESTGFGTTSTIPGTVFITNSISDQRIDQINSCAIQEDGAIVAGGFSDYDSHSTAYFTLARFFNPQTKTAYTKAYTPVGSGLNG